MKDLISKAIALGLGIGATGKEQTEKLAKKVQKQMGVTKKESKTFVNDMIKRGEKIRVSLDNQIKDVINDAAEAIDNVTPVSRKEFSELKESIQKKPAKKTTRKTTRKPAAKKTTAKKKTAAKKTAAKK